LSLLHTEGMNEHQSRFTLHKSNSSLYHGIYILKVTILILKIQIE